MTKRDATDLDDDSSKQPRLDIDDPNKCIFQNCDIDVPENEHYCAIHKSVEGCTEIVNGQLCRQRIAVWSHSRNYSAHVYKCRLHVSTDGPATVQCDYVRDDSTARNPNKWSRCKKLRHVNDKCCSRHKKFEDRVRYCAYRDESTTCNVPIAALSDTKMNDPASRNRRFYLEHASVEADLESSNNSSRVFPDTQTDETIHACLMSCQERVQNFKRVTCTICGCLTSTKSAVTKSIDWIADHRSILQRHPRLAHVPSSCFDYGIEKIDGLVLEDRGFITVANELVKEVHVCDVCADDLDNNKMPALSLCNDNWTGSHLPTPLKGLNWVEERLIALSHVSMNILKMRKTDSIKPWNIQHAKGNCYTYPANPSVIVNSLPISGADLNSVVGVVLNSKATFTQEECNKYRFFIVRKAKVRDALLWLIENNPEYRNVTLNTANLGNLPEYGIPNEVYRMLTYDENIEADNALHSRLSDVTDAILNGDLEENEPTDPLSENADPEVDASEPPATSNDMDESDSAATSNVPREVDSSGPLSDTDHINEDGPTPATNESVQLENSVPEPPTTVETFEEGMDVDLHEVSGNNRTLAHLNERADFNMITENYGASDCEGNMIASDRKLLQAFANLTSENDFFESNDPSLPIRNATSELLHVKREDMSFESEFSTSHLVRAYPTLFPYGVGGLCSRNYEKRAKSCVLQGSRYFARHVSFCFVVFNIIQKRKILRSVKAYCKSDDFTDVMQKLEGHNYAELLQDLSNRARSNSSDLGSPALNDLAKTVNSISRGIIGSRSFAEGRKYEIQALYNMYGPPHLWLTLNPSPGNHQLMFEMCGVDMTEFLRLTPEERRLETNKNIAQNPEAQATFFDELIKTYLEDLIGIHNNPVGIFGEIDAHFVMVEAQGSGNLHGHAVVWIKGAPNPKEFYEKLRDPIYRDKVIAWVDKFVYAGFDHLFDLDIELDSIEAVRAEKKDIVEDSYNSILETERDCMKVARTIAIMHNFHKHTHTCFKKGEVCRFMFGKEGKKLEPTTKIDLDQKEMIMRRTHVWANPYNPHTSQHESS